MLVYISIFCVVFFGNHVNGLNLHENVVVNGDAELGGHSSCYCNATTFPGWTSDDALVVEYFNCIISSGAPGPESRGYNHFAGGCYQSTAVMYQTIDLTSESSIIDSGSLPFTAQAFLGGYADSNDNCVMTVEFLGSSSNSLLSVDIGPVLASDRDEITSLVFRSTDGTVPVGAREANVTLIFTTVDDSNMGGADNVALIFGSPPPTASPTVQPLVLGSNVIVNGGAEDSVATCFCDSLEVSGWVSDSRVISVPWGCTIDNADPGPVSRGVNLFLSGCNGSPTFIYQTVDLSTSYVSIDAGFMIFNAEAFLGGYGVSSQCDMSVEFFSSSSSSLLSVTLAPVTSSDRDGGPGLLFRSTSGTVPAGAREARVTLTFTFIGISTGLGAADNVALSFIELAPTAQPTQLPSVRPTPTPTALPTLMPTAPPTTIPTTAAPTAAPTATPTAVPTTAAPTAAPTATPTAVPTTAAPTAAPTATPTAVPTWAPTTMPTAVPSIAPTATPTAVPTTAAPTAAPTPLPTAVPTTGYPTSAPSGTPSGQPTMLPTTVLQTHVLIACATSIGGMTSSEFLGDDTNSDVFVNTMASTIGNGIQPDDVVIVNVTDILPQSLLRRRRATASTSGDIEVDWTFEYISERVDVAVLDSVNDTAANMVQIITNAAEDGSIASLLTTSSAAFTNISVISTAFAPPVVTIAKSGSPTFAPTATPPVAESDFTLYIVAAAAAGVVGAAIVAYKRSRSLNGGNDNPAVESSGGGQTYVHVCETEIVCGRKDDFEEEKGKDDEDSVASLPVAVVVATQAPPPAYHEHQLTQPDIYKPVETSDVVLGGSVVNVTPEHPDEPAVPAQGSTICAIGAPPDEETQLGVSADDDLAAPTSTSTATAADANNVAWDTSADNVTSSASNFHLSQYTGGAGDDESAVDSWEAWERAHG